MDVLKPITPLKNKVSAGTMGEEREKEKYEAGETAYIASGKL